ncbi:MAG: hypothetical protein WD794_02915 [Mycobacteriales bacterium]
MPKNHGLLTLATGATTIAAFALLTAVAGGAAAAHLATAGGSATATSGVQADTRPAPRTDGFDPASCLPQPTAPTAGAAGGAVAVVTLVVPATTLIEVDDLGRPVSVSTNTGQAPCITDRFLRVGADGTGTPADEALSTAVLSVQFGAGWEPGVLQAFPRP